MTTSTRNKTTRAPIADQRATQCSASLGRSRCRCTERATREFKLSRIVKGVVIFGWHKRCDAHAPNCAAESRALATH